MARRVFCRIVQTGLIVALTIVNEIRQLLGQLKNLLQIFPIILLRIIIVVTVVAILAGALLAVLRAAAVRVEQIVVGIKPLQFF